MSAELIGILFFLAIMSIVLWNYYAREKKQNNFLIDRINHLSNREDNLTKSKKRLKIEQELIELNNPITYDKLMTARNMGVILSLAVFITAGLVYIGLLFALLSFKIPDIYISLKKDEREKEFNEQLPDAIKQLLALLRAGQTSRQGYQTLAKEADYPINIEFKKLFNDLNTGATNEKALNDFYVRNPSNDIKLFMIGMIIADTASPQVAINTLQTISDTIRTRESQKKSTKSAIASGKYTAIILSLLPLFTFVGMETIMPSYLNDFIATFTGKVAITLAAILDGIGYMIARKITSASKIIKY